MIADTAFLLIIIALFSGLKIGVKADKILSCLVFLFIFVVLAIFFQHRNVLEEQVFATVWNSSPSGNIMLDLSMARKREKRGQKFWNFVNWVKINPISLNLI